MARKYWKLSSAGHDYVEALIKNLEWQSLGYSELSQTLKETKKFTIDRETLAKILDRHNSSYRKHKNNRSTLNKSKIEGLISTLEDLTKDQGSTDVLSKKPSNQDCFEQIEIFSISQTEEKSGTPIKESLVTEDDLGEFDNPFQPTNCRIENPEQFFNREKEVRTIFEYLNSGSGVELLGDRQIGKSSVLLQVERLAATMLRVKREPIYFNLQEVHTEVEFYESFCEKLGIETCKGYGFFRAMRDKRLLLLLDEAEKMSWDGFTRQIREQLRSLAEGGNAPLRLVVAARTPLDDLFPDSHESGMTSPFQGICVRVDLKAWDQPTVQRFITSKLEDTGVCFSNAEMEKLWLDSQGHPQKLMKACFDLYRQYR